MEEGGKEIEKKKKEKERDERKIKRDSSQSIFMNHGALNWPIPSTNKCPCELSLY